jgi:hypothetical protein
MVHGQSAGFEGEVEALDNDGSSISVTVSVLERLTQVKRSPWMYEALEEGRFGPCLPDGSSRGFNARALAGSPRLWLAFDTTSVLAPLDPQRPVPQDGINTECMLAYRCQTGPLLAVPVKTKERIDRCQEEIVRRGETS